MDQLSQPEQGALIWAEATRATWTALEPTSPPAMASLVAVDAPAELGATSAGAEVASAPPAIEKGVLVTKMSTPAAEVLVPPEERLDVTTVAEYLHGPYFPACWGRRRRRR